MTLKGPLNRFWYQRLLVYDMWFAVLRNSGALTEVFVEHNVLALHCIVLYLLQLGQAVSVR